MNPLRLLSLTSCALALSACFVSAENREPAPVTSSSGLLVLDWTLGRTTNPEQCDQSDAPTLDVRVTNPGGALVGQFQAPELRARDAPFRAPTYSPVLRSVEPGRCALLPSLS